MQFLSYYRKIKNSACHSREFHLLFVFMSSMFILIFYRDEILSLIAQVISKYFQWIFSHFHIKNSHLLINSRTFHYKYYDNLQDFREEEHLYLIHPLRDVKTFWSKNERYDFETRGFEMSPKFIITRFLFTKLQLF